MITICTWIATLIYMHKHSEVKFENVGCLFFGTVIADVLIAESICRTIIAICT